MFKSLFAVFLLISAQSAFAIKAPDFSLPGSNNKTVSLNKLKGKVVYVDFWASWCTPCKQSFPWMNEMQTRYGKQGLEVVAINLDESKQAAVEFLQQVPANFKIAYDPQGETAEKYSLKVMPSSYIVGRNGDLVHLHRGFKAGDKADMESHITKALKNR